MPTRLHAVCTSGEGASRWRGGPLCLFVLFAVLAAGCGDDTGPLVLKPGEVVTRCTRSVDVASPFGSNRPVDRYAVEFEVPEDVSSFLVSVYREGSSTTLAELVAPSGFAIDLVLDERYERFHPAGLGSLYGMPIDVDRFQVPPAPGIDLRAAPGTWRVRADNNGGGACVSIAASGGAGQVLDLAVYVVGLESFTASTAIRNEDWVEVLRRMSAVFESAGLAVNVAGVTYIEAPFEDAVRFGVLHDWDEFTDLLATSEERDADTAMRLNVFLVRGFAGELPPGLLGVASGIPGAAGVHGTTDSGVVFGVEDYLGLPDVGEGVSGNAYLGDVMAHEIGHYLGLFHTSERFGGVDPLDDTPYCIGIDHMGSFEELVETCEDLDNLMFPFAIPGAGNGLSADQVTSLQLNPLLR